MHTLQEIIYKVNIRSVHGNLNATVNDLQVDSRKVNKGSVFIAVKGVSADGHQFIDLAVEKGAIAIVCEVLPDELNNEIIYVQVENSAAAAGFMAHNFYDQ